MKCLIWGDYALSSKQIYNEMEKLQRYGLTFTKLDWRNVDSIRDFRFITTKIEQEGPESFDLPEDVLSEAGDAEIMVIHYAPVSTKLIEASKKLKIIGCARGGYENVNVDAARGRGIKVVHAPGRNKYAVADYTIGLILAASRHIAKQHCLLKKGTWESFDVNNLPYELKDKVLGIVGFGNIGREVAKRAMGFGMNILAFDPYAEKEIASKFRAKLVDLDILLKQSDIVSLNVRLTPETFHMMGEAEFKLMKNSALFVNTSRGAIVDESALVKSLENRWIDGAALDVFEEEPIKGDHPVLKFENVVVSPHCAGATVESLFVRGPKIITEEIESLLKGEKPEHML
jgi:D-3-phosphoglycerate dehydrogenase